MLTCPHCGKQAYTCNCVGKFMTYIGPDKSDLLSGSTVLVEGTRRGDDYWCSDMNMPLYGCFSGWINKDQLK